MNRSPARPMRRIAVGATASSLFAVALMALLPAAAVAQAPADSMLRDFRITGDYLLEVGGREVPKAEIYRSDRAGAYLLISSELPAPVLLLPGARSVETVHLMKIAKRADGSLDILADAALAPQGQFVVEGERVTFAVAGKAAALKPKPPLLGGQTGASLKAYSPDYARGAEVYQPSRPILDQLRRNGGDVEVAVYFGSWCPFCAQVLPHLLKVQEELAGSGIRFRYYGLPQPMSGDPVTEKLDLRAVPTGIVYRDGREIGRIVGNSWKIPELAIQRLLTGASVTG